MFKPHSGGRKEAWDAGVRARALARAEKVGAEKAGVEFGIPSGTIRSWVRREQLKRERDAVDHSGLESVKAQGRAIVEEELARREAELERWGPPPLARGEVLSPDPYEGQRPPPGSPWPPVESEGEPEEPVEPTGSIPEPKPKKRRRRRRARAEEEPRSSSPAGASASAVNAAQHSLDAKDNLPPYALRFGDGSERTVPADDPNVGPYAKRKASTDDGA